MGMTKSNTAEPPADNKTSSPPHRCCSSICCTRAWTLRTKALTAFVALYTIPVIKQEPPKNVRLEPIY
jgi:hypothetical protein